MAKNIRQQLAALLDTEPKRLDLHMVIVNPSGSGSWVGACELGGIKVVGSPGDTPSDAARNLFDRLTASRGYMQDSEVQIALEMAFAGADVSRFLEPSTVQGELPNGAAETDA